VRPDGSFDLFAPSLQLRNCYPSFDGVAVHPTAVQVSHSGDEHSVEYSLAHGTVALQLSVCENVAVVACTLRGLVTAPHWVYPCGSAEVTGTAKFFRQGLGFAGPSGWLDLEAPPYKAAQRTEAGAAPSWFLESYLISGLMAGDGTALSVAALDHRDYLQKSTLRERQQRRGLINRHLATSTLLLEVGFATEGVISGDETTLPQLHFRFASDACTAFAQTAQAIGAEMQACSHHAPRYHWCSWYRRGPYFTNADLDEVLHGLETVTPRVPLQAVQIDDGYFTAHGDWLEHNERWPHGMQAAFASVEQHGYEAGIWVAPFMVSNRSRLFVEHPDWVLRDLRGASIIEARNYEGTASDEERYVLDTSHPEAMSYLRNVFRTLRGWGARLFKTDFMDWGFQDSLSVQRHTPGKTSVQYFRDALQMIREEIGEESYWLACISPFAPFLGYADGMRVANDSGVSWNAGGTLNMFREMCAGQYFNGVWWHNDPDSVFLREHFLHLGEAEIESIALFAGIMGSSVNTSDWLHEVPEHRLLLWRFLQPSQHTQNAVLPFWSCSDDVIVAVRFYPQHRAWAVLILNLSGQVVTRRLALAPLTGCDRHFCFDWNATGSTAQGSVSELIVELSGHGSLLHYLAQDDSPPPANLTLGGALL
jgi:hypothetical protein